MISSSIETFTGINQIRPKEVSLNSIGGQSLSFFVSDQPSTKMNQTMIFVYHCHFSSQAIILTRMLLLHRFLGRVLHLTTSCPQLDYLTLIDIDDQFFFKFVQGQSFLRWVEFSREFKSRLAIVVDEILFKHLNEQITRLIVDINDKSSTRTPRESLSMTFSSDSFYACHYLIKFHLDCVKGQRRIFRWKCFVVINIANRRQRRKNRGSIGFLREQTVQVEAFLVNLKSANISLLSSDHPLSSMLHSKNVNFSLQTVIQKTRNILFIPRTNRLFNAVSSKVNFNQLVHILRHSLQPMGVVAIPIQLQITSRVYLTSTLLAIDSKVFHL